MPSIWATESSPPHAWWRAPDLLLRSPLRALRTRRSRMLRPRRLLEPKQYCSHGFQKALVDCEMKSSMSRMVDWWDNAPTAESLWGRLKVGRLYGRRFATRREAMDEVTDWLTFYTHRRLHSTLGYVSPMTFERRWSRPSSKKASPQNGQHYGVRTTGARSPGSILDRHIRKPFA